MEPGRLLRDQLAGGADRRRRSHEAAAVIRGWGFPLDPAAFERADARDRRDTRCSRAPAARRASPSAWPRSSRSVLGGPAVKALWYHFAIMFEALFILTTLDAGTRVGRFMVQDLLGHLCAPLGRTSSLPANLLASALIVARLGLLPLPGRRRSARRHQLALAALRHREPAARRDRARARDDDRAEVARGRVYALAPALPLAWLLTVTMTAGWQKIFARRSPHRLPRPGGPPRRPARRGR